MPQSGMSLVDRPSAREVVFSRLLNAPPELVWKTWSDVEHLQKWFGPAGFTITTEEFEFVEGGAWRFMMHGPDGTDYPNRIVFREIVPPARLRYENNWDLLGAPLGFSALITFVAVGRQTRLTIHLTFADEAAFRIALETYGVMDGGTQTLDRLARYLAA